MKLPASDTKSKAGATISSAVAILLSSAWRANAAANSGGLPRTMSVSTAPGAKALTRMPSAANSAAMERVKDTIDALAAAYIDVVGEKMNAPAETIFSTAA